MKQIQCPNCKSYKTISKKEIYERAKSRALSWWSILFFAPIVLSIFKVDQFMYGLIFFTCWLFSVPIFIVFLVFRAKSIDLDIDDIDCLSCDYKFNVKKEGQIKDEY